jgi:hypothetical protein
MTKLSNFFLQEKFSTSSNTGKTLLGFNTTHYRSDDERYEIKIANSRVKDLSHRVYTRIALSDSAKNFAIGFL